MFFIWTIWMFLHIYTYSKICCQSRQTIVQKIKNDHAHFFIFQSTTVEDTSIDVAGSAVVESLASE
jgi:hypothetical protein